MKRDPLQQYVALRTVLQKEKYRLEDRIHQISGLLGQDGTTSSSRLPALTPKRIHERARNKLSLRQAILKATASKPLTKPEILAAIQNLGYTFTTAKPMNSINFILYGKNPKFRNQQGKFSPVP